MSIKRDIADFIPDIYDLICDIRLFIQVTTNEGT